MNYYYLLAGLPDLTLTMDTRKIDFPEVLDTIRRNLTQTDEQQFQYLLYPNDNRNLLDTLFHKYYDFPPTALAHPYTIGSSELKDYRRQQAAFPSYMVEFLSEEEQFTNMSSREMESQLWHLFYEETTDQSPFIAQYFRFERKLKEVTAAYHHSLFSFLSSPLLEDDSIQSQVGVGKSTTPSLQKEYPYVEALGEKITAENPTDLEHFIDQIKWDYLEQYREPFSREQVFAYSLKSLLVIRNQLRSDDSGQARFTELQQTIKSSVSSPLISLS
ncbi:MAG: DUF2764 family protein [Bacteroidota bacterium]